MKAEAIYYLAIHEVTSKSGKRGQYLKIASCQQATGSVTFISSRDCYSSIVLIGQQVCFIQGRLQTTLIFMSSAIGHQSYGHCNIFLRGTLLSPQRLLFPINSRGLLQAFYQRQDSTYHSLGWTSCGPLVALILFQF